MFIDTDDALLHAVSFGPGPHAVLALNGWSATWQAWQPTLELLSADVRCIGYDTRGTGGSTGAPESITLDRLVDDAVAVLDAYGVERCVVAGESLGAFLALHLAARHPERIDALVLVAAPAAVTPDHVAPLVTGSRHDYRATIAAFVTTCLNEPMADRLHQWGVHLFDQADAEVAARLFECCFDRHVDPSAIAVPTFLVHGELDLVVPADSSRFLAAAIPGAELEVLGGVGHAPTVTAPAVVAAAVRRALALASAGV